MYIHSILSVHLRFTVLFQKIIKEHYSEDVTIDDCKSRAN